MFGITKRLLFYASTTTMTPTKVRGNENEIRKETKKMDFFWYVFDVACVCLVTITRQHIFVRNLHDEFLIIRKIFILLIACDEHRCNDGAIESIEPNEKYQEN